MPLIHIILQVVLQEREKAAVRDMQAAEERAKETTSLARFHLKQ